MRHLIFGLCLLLPALPAQATVIEFAPSLFVAPPEGSSSFTIENFSIVEQSTTTSESGSGSSLATITDYDRADIRVALGDGPGEARASLVNEATFDIVFEEPVEVGLAFGVGINGPISSGLGDISFADWAISIIVGGELFESSQSHRCVDGAPSNSCGNFFDSGFRELPFTIGDDLRLTVNTTMIFDIGVSRAAVVVSEPGTLAMLLLSLGWIGRRRLTAVSRA